VFSRKYLEAVFSQRWTDYNQTTAEIEARLKHCAGKTFRYLSKDLGTSLILDLSLKYAPCQL
jgi:hypothetical protein